MPGHTLASRLLKGPLPVVEVLRLGGQMADALAAGKMYPPFIDDPEDCADTMYKILVALWQARAALARQ